MNVLMAIIVLFVTFSRLKSHFVASENLENNYDYPSTNQPLTIEEFENNSEGNKRSFVLRIPAENIDEIEKMEKNADGNWHKLPSLIRKVRCKYPRPPRKSRRTTVSVDLREHIPTSRSAPKKGIAYKKASWHKASTEKTKLPRNTLGSSKSINREDKIRTETILQPRPQDAVILVGVEDEGANKKSYTPYISLKNKRRPDALIRYSSDEIPEESPHRGENEDSRQQPEHSSSRISTEDSLNSKPLSKPSSSQRLQRGLHKKTPSSYILPCASEPKTISQPMKVGIPFIGNRNLGTSLYEIEKKVHYDVYEPLEIQPDVLYPTNLMPYDTPEYPSYDKIEYPPYTEMPMYDDKFPDDRKIDPTINADRLFAVHKEFLPDTDVATETENNADTNKCIKIYGPESSILTSASSHDRSYVHIDPSYSTMDSHQKEVDHYAIAEAAQSQSQTWKNPTNFDYIVKSNGPYTNREINDNEEERPRHATEFPLETFYEQQPISVYQFITLNPLKGMSSNDDDQQTASTANYDLIDSEPRQRQTEAKEFVEYDNYVETMAPQDHRTSNAGHGSIVGSTDENDDYVETSKDSKKNSFSKEESKEIMMEYPSLYRSKLLKNYEIPKKLVTNGAKMFTIKSPRDDNDYIVSKDLTLENDESDLSNDYSGLTGKMQEATNHKQRTTQTYDYAEIAEQSMNVAHVKSFKLTTQKPQTSFAAIEGSPKNEAITNLAEDRNLKRFPDYQDSCNLHDEYKEHEETLQSFSGQIARPFMQNVDQSAGEGNDVSVQESVLATLVGMVVDNFQTARFNSSEADAERPGVIEDLAVMRRLFYLPEVQDLAIHDVKRMVSDMGDVNEFGFSLALVAESTIANVLKGVLNSLSMALGPELLPMNKMTEDFQLNRQEASSKQGLKKYIENLLHKSGIDAEEAKSPIAQNIIFRTVEHSLKNTGVEMENSVIWDALKAVLSQPRLTKNYPAKKKSMEKQLFKTNNTDAVTKKLPIIHVREHVFQEGVWTEKNTVLGKKRQYIESEGSGSTTVQTDNEVHTSSEKSIFTEIIKGNRSIAGTVNMYHDDVSLEVSTVKKENASSKEEDEKTPIKYYSPIDRILEYRKKVQTPHMMRKEKTTTGLHPAGIRNLTQHTTEVSWTAIELMPMDSTTATEDPFTSYRKAESKVLSDADLSSNENIVGDKISNVSERSKTTDAVALGIVNIDIFGQDISTPHNEESMKDNTPMLEFKPINPSSPTKKTGTIMAGGVQLNSAVKNMTEHPIEEVIKTSANGQKHSQSSTERLTSPQDNTINAKTPPNLNGRSNSATSEYDPTFFGRITSNSMAAIKRKMSDLSSAELFYIGDGVKIPLKIAKMPDNSWVLSISEKICDHFAKRKCSCSISNESATVEKMKRSNEVPNGKYNQESSTPKTPHGSIDHDENSVSVNESKGRYTRSFLNSAGFATSTTPVMLFPEKDHLARNLKEFPESSSSWGNKIESIEDNMKPLDSAIISKSFEHSNAENTEGGNNIKIRFSDDYDSSDTSKRATKMEKLSSNIRNDGIVGSLPKQNFSPQNEKSTMVAKAMTRLINSVSAQNLSPMLDYYDVDEQNREDSAQDHTSGNDDNHIDTMAVKIANHGYEKDKALLDRIRLITKERMKSGRYRYQKYIDHEAKERVDALTSVLRWLKEVLLESTVDQNI